MTGAYPGTFPQAYNPGDNGTSFATAFVSGVAALVRAAYPGLGEAQVVTRIAATADGPAGPGTGGGMVNPVQAVTAVLPARAEAGRHRGGRPGHRRSSRAGRPGADHPRERARPGDPHGRPVGRGGRGRPGGPGGGGSAGAPGRTPPSLAARPPAAVTLRGQRPRRLGTSPRRRIRGPRLGASPSRRVPASPRQRARLGACPRWRVPASAPPALGPLPQQVQRQAATGCATGGVPSASPSPSSATWTRRDPLRRPTRNPRPHG